MTQEHTPVNGDFQIIAVKRPAKEKFTAPFFVAFLRAQKDIGLMKLPKLVIWVYLCLLGTLEYENYIYVKQETLALELKSSQANVSRALATLVAKGIIEEIGFKNRMKCYRLSPTIGWRGRVDNIKRIKQV
jgi:hypothetical protein